MPDEWGDSWNDPGAGNYDYSGPSFGGGQQNEGGWSLGGTLGGIAGGVLGMGALGPLGAALGAKGGYKAGDSIDRALRDAMSNAGGMPSMGEMGFTSGDRASEERYLQAMGVAKPKSKLTFAQMIGAPADYNTMSPEQKAAILRDFSTKPKLQNKKPASFTTKANGTDVFAVGVNANTGRRLFGDDQGNIYNRKSVKKGPLKQLAEPTPTPAPGPAPGPTGPTQPDPLGYYQPLGGTPPNTPHGNAYGPDQPTPDWGYTPADIEYMYRASGLGHLVDDGFGVEQMHFPNEPSFQIANSGRYVKKAKGGLIQGPGTGTSDSIPATIDGTQPARLSNNEFVMTEKAVKGFGGGNVERGASALQMLMRMAERNR